MEDSVFEINILPALHGDCIHLRFCSAGKWYNIVIDSGPAMHEQSFFKLMNRFKASEEQLDLLCLTHMDDDHILAVKNYLGNPKRDSSFIKHVWINVPDDEIEAAKSIIPSSVCTTGAKKASKLYGFIYNRQIPHSTKIQRGQTMYFGDVLVQAVLPTPERLDEYFEEWRRQKEQKAKSKPTSANDDDDSAANGGSIALFVWAMGQKMLFSGDAFAPDLKEVAEKWAGDGFDLVKLPHHGSNANISDEMLEAMKCRRFIISANGTMDRPTQKTVDILGGYGSKHGEVTLYGNYHWRGIKKKDGVTIELLTKEPLSFAEGMTLRTE